MAGLGVASVFAAAALLIGVLTSIPTAVQSIGVCYGTHGDGLPSPADVVQLYCSNGIGGMRIYSPDGTILQALWSSGIDVIVGEDNLDSLVAYAPGWVQANIQRYKGDVNFKYIAIGNEVEGGEKNSVEQGCKPMPVQPCCRLMPRGHRAHPRGKGRRMRLQAS